MPNKANAADAKSRAADWQQYNMKKCNLCRAEIPDDATYCSHCNMHQSSLKNWIPQIINAIALLAFIAAIASWGIEKSTNFFTKMTWKDDIRVISFNSSKNLTVRNIGDGSVFIERIDVRSKKGYGSGFVSTTSIEKVLEKNQIVSFTIGDGVGVSGGRILFQNDEYKVDGQNMANLLKGSDPNIQRLVFDKDNGMLMNYKNIAREDAIIFDAEATLYYFSLFNDSATTVKFMCEGVFAKLK